MSSGAPGGRRRPHSRFTSLPDAIRSEGVAWVWRRVRYRTPTTRWGRLVHARLRRVLGALLAPPRQFLQGRAGTPRAGDDTLYAFYDLQVASITYNACWFAAAADLARRRRGLRRIHFVIVPGTKGGVREERAVYEAAVDAAQRIWRVHNIVIPILTLVPSCAGYTVLPDRGAAEALRADAGERVYPEYYELALPVSTHPSELLTLRSRELSGIGVLRSSVQGLRYVERWMAPRLRGRRMISITLRDYSFMTARNSNIDAWTAFAGRLDPATYLPVFVLDTERTLDPLPARLEGFEVLREASWNVGLRMAVYESSYLTLGVNNGPLFLAAMNDRTRLLMFKMITPSVPQTTEEFLRQEGFQIGRQLPFATPFQRVIWEDDVVEVIEREFEAMIAHIEGAADTEVLTGVAARGVW
jgi:hypothetical protein